MLTLVCTQRNSQKALAQIPFTSKKQKPPVLRTDYWSPLCLIRFGQGQGEVGRNVFQKLREFRQLHELSWGWQAKELKKLSKRKRGEVIHNQKPNAIADIAAVLGGAGKGNKMWLTKPRSEPIKDAAEETLAAAPEEVETETPTASETPAESATEASSKVEAATSEETTVTRAPQAPQNLVKATIYWANDLDLHWAREWSDNVEHQVGLPDDMVVQRWTTKIMMDTHEEPPAPEDTAKEEGEEAGEDGQEGEKGEKAEEAQEGEKAAAQEAEVEQKEQKKGWLGWLSKKSSDARV